MLRVNLIRRRIEAARERRVWWTAGGLLSAASLVSAAAFTVVCATDLSAISAETRRMSNEIATVRGDTEEAAAQQRQYVLLKSVDDLVWDVQVTASRWGRLLYDIDRSIPMRSGAWLTSIETRYDKDTEVHRVVLEGHAQRPEQVSSLQSDLQRLDSTFDPSSVASPASGPAAGEGTISFRIEAALAKPIGVRFQ